MSGNPNDSSSAAPHGSRSRRNRRLRSPDAAAHAANPAASGYPHDRLSFQPRAPRDGQGQGQAPGLQARSGSGLHQTIHNHYHYSPYEGTSGVVNGGVDAGNGRRRSVAARGEGPATDVRGVEWGFVNDSRERGHGQESNPSQGYDFPAANTRGYWPGPGPRPGPWFPPPGHPMFYPPQNGGGGGGGGGSHGAPNDFYVGMGWGRSPYGA